MRTRKVLFSLFVAYSALLACPANSQQVSAKPTIDPVVRKAADALGMVRWNDYARGAEDRESLDLLNRIEILATGTGHEVRRGVTGAPYTIGKLVMGISLLTPAIRLDMQRRDAAGKETHTIQVARGDLAWDESQPGIGSTGPLDSARERLRQLYLLPHGFMRAVIKSPPPDVTVSQDAAGNTVLAVTIEGQRARATLDKDLRPATIELPFVDKKSGKGLLKSELSGYKDFEGYEVFYPTHIVETLNGKPLLDLNVTQAMTGVYLSYPIPEAVKAASAAPKTAGAK